LELDPSATQVAELHQVAELYGACAQDNGDSSLSRRAKVSELWYRVAGELSPGNIQGHSPLPRSCQPRRADRSRFAVRERNGTESRNASTRRGVNAPNKPERQIIVREGGGRGHGRGGGQRGGIRRTDAEVSAEWTSPLKYFLRHPPRPPRSPPTHPSLPLPPPSCVRGYRRQSNSGAEFAKFRH
jgi:hypothetical protein